MSQSMGVLEEMTRQLSVEIPRVIDRGLENLRNSDERRTGGRFGGGNLYFTYVFKDELFCSTLAVFIVAGRPVRT